MLNVEDLDKEVPNKGKIIIGIVCMLLSILFGFSLFKITKQFIENQFHADHGFYTAFFISLTLFAFFTSVTYKVLFQYKSHNPIFGKYFVFIFFAVIFVLSTTFILYDLFQPSQHLVLYDIRAATAPIWSGSLAYWSFKRLKGKHVHK